MSWENSIRSALAASFVGLDRLMADDLSDRPINKPLLRRVSTDQNDSDDLYMRLATVRDALSDANLRADQAVSALMERVSQAESLQVDLSDRDRVVEDLRNQVKFCEEHSRLLASENTVLRSEAKSVEADLARSLEDLAAARARICELDQQIARVALESEDRAEKLALLVASRDAIEAAVEQERRRRAALEAQVAAIGRGEARDAAGGDRLGSERVSLMMKLNSAENGRIAAEQALAQLRERLVERDEAFRALERDLRDAKIAKESADRRLESARTDLARQSERIMEMQRVQTDLNARSETLVKTLSARDVSLERLGARNAKLTEQVDQANERHAAARKELQEAVETHAEELRVERSERAMMQRALEIARASRASLQKRHDDLRRSGRSWHDSRAEQAATAAPDAAEPESNVHPLYGVR